MQVLGHFFRVLPTHMTIGERLEHFAQSRYRTMVEFAKAVGMSKQQVSNYVNAVNGPGAKVLLRFASAGVNIHWLLTGDGDMDAPKQATAGTTVSAVANVSTDVEYFTVEQLQEALRRVSEEQQKK